MSKDNSLQSAMGRGGQDSILHEALDRLEGASAPERDQLQSAMGRESQVRAAIDVLAQRQ